MVMGTASALLYKDDLSLSTWSSENIILTMGVCCVCMIFSFTILLCAIDKKYTKTFTSFLTGNKCIQEYFTHGTKDEYRAQILECHEVRIALLL